MAKRTVPVTETPVATRPATFSLDDPVIKQAIAEAVAAAMALKEAEQAAKPAKTDQSAKNLLKTVAVFKKAGYGVVVPHQDTKTFNLWIKEGLRPKEGMHALKVQNLRLFHRSQCRPLTKAEAGDFAKKFKEAEAKRSAKSATVTALHQPA